MEALDPPTVVPDHQCLTIRIILRDLLTQFQQWQDQEGHHYLNNQACRLQFPAKEPKISIKPRHNIRTLLDQVDLCLVGMPLLLDFQEDLLDMNKSIWCQCIQEDQIQIWSTKITKIWFRKTRAFNHTNKEWDHKVAHTKCPSITRICKANLRLLLIPAWFLQANLQGSTLCQWLMRTTRLNVMRVRLSGRDTILSLATNCSLTKIAEGSKLLHKKPSLTQRMLSQSFSCLFFKTWFQRLSSIKNSIWNRLRLNVGMPNTIQDVLLRSSWEWRILREPQHWYLRRVRWSLLEPRVNNRVRTLPSIMLELLRRSASRKSKLQNSLFRTWWHRVVLTTKLILKLWCTVLTNLSALLILTLSQVWFTRWERLKCVCWSLLPAKLLWQVRRLDKTSTRPSATCSQSWNHSLRETWETSLSECPRQIEKR